VNYETQIQKTNSDLDRLRAVLNNIHEHNEFLKQQYEAYQEYLESVRRNSFTSFKKDGKSTKSTKKVQKRGPFKFSHVKLQQDGVIIESEVPEERFFFSFFFFCNLEF
jgi:Ras GTPase-activating-like protein IQGAP2/3